MGQTKEQRRAYYRANRERILARQRRRRDSGEAQATKNAWYAATREQRLKVQRAWHTANRDRVREKARKYEKANREKLRECRRAWAYGITVEDLRELLARGKCDICKATEPGSRHGWHVDHCHSSGRVRGLLCHHCNTGLGGFRDDPRRLKAAAKYLEKHHNRK